MPYAVSVPHDSLIQQEARSVLQCFLLSRPKLCYSGAEWPRFACKRQSCALCHDGESMSVFS